jgi:4-hydroxy-3-methylbut-2-enyl diphosphate reductase
MSIKIAKTAGFCYGVKRAVDEVYRQIESGAQIATFGELIHNTQVVDDLKSRGVKVYREINDVPEGVTLALRTHGVSKDIKDLLNKKNVSYIDLTCPFVNKIHKIVNEYYKKGYKIIIVGDKTHPEVKGINGWCGSNAYIIDSFEYEIPQEFSEKDVCVVAQTTINRKNFVQIVQNIKKTCQSTLIFDTICNATRDRQTEAEQISQKCDVMFVVGGHESSNTKKLFEISKLNCSQTYHIETFRDIPRSINLKNKKIGITAGASTPRRIIEEVVTTMDENVKNEEFAQLLEQYEGKTLNNGDIVDGTVIDVNNTEAVVDLGGFKYNGILKADQITDDPYAKITDLVKTGDTITVYVVGVNDAEGKVVLSRKKLVAMESWNKMKSAYENGEILDGKIIRAVKGGVIVLCDGTQVFVPAKHASARYVQDLTTLLNEEVKFKLIDIDERRRRVVGSVRVILEEAKKAVEDKFWSDVAEGKIAEGQVITGVVKKIMPFGAFVDIGGVDGLVHISELSWNKIKDPSEVIHEGEAISVNIRALDPEKKKISLGYKKQEDNPWNIVKSKYSVGDVVSCKIVRMMPFGAFAEIMPSVDGLIHISQIADRRIDKPEDVLKIGEVVEAKITEANWDERKISLSIRALIEPKIEETLVEEEQETVLPADEAEVPVDIEAVIREQAEAEVAEVDDAKEEHVEAAAEENEAAKQEIASEETQEVKEEADEEKTEEE